jgi:hypothetical protein
MPIVESFSDTPVCEPFKAALMEWFLLFNGEDTPILEKILNTSPGLDDFRIDVVYYTDEDRFKYIYAGAALEELYGEKLSNRYLDDLYNMWFRRRAVKDYKQVMKTKKPFYEKRNVSTLTRKIGYHKLVLPIETEIADEFFETTSKQFLTYVIPTNQDIKTKDDWARLVDETPWL